MSNETEAQLAAWMAGKSETVIRRALFRDPLTDCYNRRAFETIASPSQVVGIADLDSLKWLNDNLGHRVGDDYLVELAYWLCEYFGEDHVFRLSGDEFVVTARKGQGCADVERAFRAAAAKLVYFSWGVGNNLEEADQRLRQHKARREASGNRAARGEMPWWVELSHPKRM